MDRHTIEYCLKESREFLKVRYGVKKIGILVLMREMSKIKQVI